MKLKNSLFLSRANLHGSMRKSAVFTMMILAVVAVVLLAGFSNIFTNMLTTYKNDPALRTVFIFPAQNFFNNQTGEYDKGTFTVNDAIREDILNIDHVLSCEPLPYSRIDQAQMRKATMFLLPSKTFLSKE